MRENRVRLGSVATVVGVLLASGCRIVVGLLALAIAGAIVTGFIGAAIRGELGPQPLPTPTTSRTIMKSTLPLQEHWREAGLFLFWEEIAASGEYICFADFGYRRWQQEARLHVWSARNGEPLWAIAGLPPVSSLATDGQRLFVAVHWHLRTYDLTNGELLWRTPGYVGDRIQPLGEEIVVYSTEDSLNRWEQVIRRYDAQSGVLKEMLRIEVPPNVRLVLRSSSTDYWTDGRRLWAEDRISGEVRWERRLERRLENWLVLTGSSLIYASGLYPRLYAVDATTGVLQWAYTSPLVSNFALGNNILYAIRQDGALVGIDPQTGQERGYIQFSPSETEEGPRSITYWVETSNNWVFVYFGDSQELIALGP